MKQNVYKKGVYTIPIAAAVAGVVTLGGWIATYYNNINHTNQQISEVRKDVAVDKNQIQNLAQKVEEVDDDVQKLDAKMDTLLERFGVQYIEKREGKINQNSSLQIPQTQMMTPLPVASNSLKNAQ